MTDAATLPLADTSDMAQIHRVFRSALAEAPELVGSVADGDTERAELVASYYLNVLALLHAHHEGEDELLTPKLIERLPEQAGLIERVAGQHQGVLTGLEASESGLRAWRDDPTIDAGAVLAGTLATLGADLARHLDEEEREIVPLAATCINVAEWGELPGHALRTFTGDKMWLILGLVREQFTAEQIAEMEAHMPAALTEFWRSTGQGLFDEFMAALHG